VVQAVRRLVTQAVPEAQGVGQPPCLDVHPQETTREVGSGERERLHCSSLTQAD